MLIWILIVSSILGGQKDGNSKGDWRAPKANLLSHVIFEIPDMPWVCACCTDGSYWEREDGEGVRLGAAEGWLSSLIREGEKLSSISFCTNQSHPLLKQILWGGWWMFKPNPPLMFNSTSPFSKNPSFESNLSENSLLQPPFYFWCSFGNHSAYVSWVWGLC